MQEWPLVAFSLLMQMCVGVFIILEIGSWLLSMGQEVGPRHRIGSNALVAIVLGCGIAVVLSFFHLGRPENAWRSLSNLGSSWLSREILLIPVFTAGVAITWILRRMRLHSQGFQRGVALVTGMVGLLLLYVMARLYMLKTVPVWNNPITLVSVFASSFLLGGLAILAGIWFFCPRTRPDKEKSDSLFHTKSIRLVILISILLVCVEIFLTPLLISVLTSGTPAAYASLNYLVRNNLPLLIFRVILLLFTLILLSFAYFKKYTPQERRDRPSWAVLPAFFLVLIAEWLGKMLFYAAYARTGL
jgi:anaerobic dimethyl sulfoxide reductase subunit C (anchor subunit)